MRKVIVMLLLFAPCAVAAQGRPRVELTPFVGYRWGGDIKAEDIDLFAIDVELDQGSSFGLMLDFPVNRWFQVELLLSRQATEFVDDEGGLFAGGEPLADVDVTYFHVGALGQWDGRSVDPYLVVSLGVTKIDPRIPLVNDENRFSASFGGGLKVMFNRHLGLRIDTRFYVTDTDDQDWDWDDCEDDCWHGYYDNDLFQGELTVGLHLTL